MTIIIDHSRKKLLNDEFEKEYFSQLIETLHNKKEEGERIFPPGSQIFNAFNITPVDNVKIVILGQDPYHGLGQAHGLSFSVPDGVKQPPSLKNIFKEIVADCGGEAPESGNLTNRAEQGVLLLNSVLTVKAQTPASHKGIGRETFTDAVIKKISDEKEGVVFMLRGNFAKGKSILIDSSKHYILEAPHPSPFSAYTGFFGCKHFSKSNARLKERGKKEIVWL